MSHCDHLQPLLSEYVDRTLTGQALEDVRAHLSICASCRHLADDLDRVSSAARSLAPIAPPPHLWLEIAGRARLQPPEELDTEARPARLSHLRQSRADTWQWLGLAAALVLATIGVYSLAQPSELDTISTATADASNVQEPPTVETLVETMRRAEAEYEKAIAQLKEVALNDDESISAETIATLERNLTTIDTAIAESQVALNDNPESQPARTSLFEALRNKMNVLQNTVVLMNAMREGDASGAAEAAAGLKKTS